MLIFAAALPDFFCGGRGAGPAGPGEGRVRRGALGVPQHTQGFFDTLAPKKRKSIGRNDHSSIPSDAIRSGGCAAAVSGARQREFFFDNEEEFDPGSG